MSVLNQSGEEQVECPLCMEPLEVDDLNFYPCTCGYQICRFCWHRIRTDENGLCPACRKAYSENPADFIPLSQEQVAKLKAEKRQRDQQRKAKLSESRKHLASVRVVQRNLVFVVGLPMRLADPEILKRHEYFGKFGKIHKVVINQSTSYAGSQGPSASAYVTYMKSDDALRAIQSVNNIPIDGRLIKSSLGTTKYCSHFMKNLPCPKPDCMYLHDFGDPEASFTKEQMHAGKHQEYEKKLHDQLLQKTMIQASNSNPAPTQLPSEININGKPTAKCREPPALTSCGIPQSLTTVVTSTTIHTITNSTSNSSNGTVNSTNNSKDNWPQLNNNGEKEKADKKSETSKEKSLKGKSKSKNNNTDGKKEKSKGCEVSSCQNSSCTRYNINSHTNNTKTDSSKATVKLENISLVNQNTTVVKNREDKPPSEAQQIDKDNATVISSSKLTTTLDDNTSFFSQNSFQKIAPEEPPSESDIQENTDNPHQSAILTDSLPEINTSEDWMAAFGFSEQKNYLENLANITKAKISSNQPVKDTLETFSNGYSTAPFINPIDPNLGKHGEYNRFYDMFKFPENGRIDPPSGLTSSQTGYKNGYTSYNKGPGQEQHNHYNSLSQNNKVLINNSNGRTTQALNNLDQMSKFLLETAQKYGQRKYVFNGENSQNGGLQYPPMNGYDGIMPPKAMQTQQEIEEQLLQLSLGRYCEPQKNGTKQFVGPHSNGMVQQSQPLNGTRYGGAGVPHMYQNGIGHGAENGGIHEEDELDFDPIQETQKAFAELIASEQSHTQVNRGRSSVPTNQMNGISQNLSGINNLPPPPPGFVQPNTHMNSFGSKILPFLNMASNQQINGTTTQNGWSNGYTQYQQQQHLQQQMRPQPQIRQQYQQQSHNKNVNDWKTLDPAILSSSRHFPLANMPPTNYTLQQQLESQQNNGGGGPLRYFDYNNFSHINTQQNLNWFTSELNSQINSPPGFRNTTQATKQQEC